MAQVAQNIPEFVSTETVARITGRSQRTIEKDRLTGYGPPHYKFGSRVLYRLDEVFAWADSCKRQSTTTDSEA
ncbi:MAG: helix-turn-helix domain-containing protein [Proteobacteria bacterium]|nr:helix-turn-helix domain-containing protein [Pseudomonadota bacterium]